MADDVNAPNKPSQKKTNILSIFSLLVSLFSLVLIVIVGIFVFSLFQKVNHIENPPLAELPEFVISNYSLDEDVHEYDYIEDTVTYSGSGVIMEKTGQDCNYIVLFKRTLLSGGDEMAGTESFSVISMVDGYAEFSTYDYGDVGAIDEPVYEFEIVGYVELDN